MAFARHQPCIILQRAGISCTVWFEDALAHYGVPTDVFSLYVLVADIDQARQALVHNGWTDALEPPETLTHFLLCHPEVQRRRLNPPASDAAAPHWMVSTVLLPADDWYFPAQELAWSASQNHFYPSLPPLTNSLISKLLDAPHASRLQSTMALYLVYLYGHVKPLKDREFTKNIMYENRRFHSDAVAGLSVGTLPVIEEERRFRDQLRSEKH
ncbi:uncharacterized protein E0L32_005612 [Thyridium curvatum]|uniref:Uncharacterized protein n=1 Tax=Thyridium curvatum TaxID=1093900 RepID=A0A507AVB6_9PEZI|nr:uncharacterized protein E0L32_005612 [Thyridium curvatum]TPX13912.1 hypothetical protein E0L32_005612 [Thyridium curvatum]